MEPNMDENYIVNVEFLGRNSDHITEVQVVPCNIAWEDLELMVSNGLI